MAWVGVGVGGPTIRGSRRKVSGGRYIGGRVGVVDPDISEIHKTRRRSRQVDRVDSGYLRNASEVKPRACQAHSVGIVEAIGAHVGAVHRIKVDLVAFGLDASGGAAIAHVIK